MAAIEESPSFSITAKLTETTARWEKRGGSFRIASRIVNVTLIPSSAFIDMIGHLGTATLKTALLPICVLGTIGNHTTFRGKKLCNTEWSLGGIAENISQTIKHLFLMIFGPPIGFVTPKNLFAFAYPIQADRVKVREEQNNQAGKPIENNSRSSSESKEEKKIDETPPIIPREDLKSSATSGDDSTSSEHSSVSSDDNDSSLSEEDHADIDTGNTQDPDDNLKAEVAPEDPAPIPVTEVPAPTPPAPDTPADPVSPDARLENPTPAINVPGSASGENSPPVKPKNLAKYGTFNNQGQFVAPGSSQSPRGKPASAAMDSTKNPNEESLFNNLYNLFFS